MHIHKAKMKSICVTVNQWEFRCIVASTWRWMVQRTLINWTLCKEWGISERILYATIFVLLINFIFFNFTKKKNQWEFDNDVQLFCSRIKYVYVTVDQCGFMFYWMAGAALIGLSNRTVLRCSAIFIFFF